MYLPRDAGMWRYAASGERDLDEHCDIDDSEALSPVTFPHFHRKLALVHVLPLDQARLRNHGRTEL